MVRASVATDESSSNRGAPHVTRAIHAAVTRASHDRARLLMLTHEDGMRVRTAHDADPLVDARLALEPAGIVGPVCAVGIFEQTT